jgi:hypothetical protein
MTVNKIKYFMTNLNYQETAVNGLTYNEYSALKIDNSVFWGDSVAVAPGIAISVSGNFLYSTKVNTHILAPTEIDPQFKNEVKLKALTGT